MSPDRRPHFPWLQYAADEAERKKAEAERKAAEEHHADAGHGGHGGHGEYDPIVEAHHQAGEHLERSEFPGLVHEMSELYNRLGIGKFVYLKDGWPARVVPGHSKVVSESPLELPASVSYIGANWNATFNRRLSLDINLGKLSRQIDKTFFEHQEVQGLFVIAYSTGTIKVFGKYPQVLKRTQWEGNPDVQAEALNTAFHRPLFAVRSK